MNHINIEKARINDLQSLLEIGRSTFIETFAAVNTPENMRHYLDNAFSHETISASLQQPDIEYYLAKNGEQTVGYLKLNIGSTQTELKTDNSMEIERIYVSKTYHGQNIGQLLMNKAIELAIDRKVEFVWLGVWEENLRAISFYKKCGFVEFDKHIFKLGDDEQTDLLMKLKIRETESTTV